MKMLFGIFKKQTSESATALMQKAEACLADEKQKLALVQKQLDEFAIGAWVGSIAAGEDKPTPDCPQELTDRHQSQIRKVIMAESVLKAARENFERIVATEQEKKEA